MLFSANLSDDDSKVLLKIEKRNLTTHDSPKNEKAPDKMPDANLRPFEPRFGLKVCKTGFPEAKTTRSDKLDCRPRNRPLRAGGRIVDSRRRTTGSTWARPLPN